MVSHGTFMYIYFGRDFKKCKNEIALSSFYLVLYSTGALCVLNNIFSKTFMRFFIA